MYHGSQFKLKSVAEGHYNPSASVHTIMMGPSVHYLWSYEVNIYILTNSRVYFIFGDITKTYIYFLKTINIIITTTCLTLTFNLFHKANLYLTRLPQVFTFKCINQSKFWDLRLVLIWKAGPQNVTIQTDLSAQLKLVSFSCKSCAFPRWQPESLTRVHSLPNTLLMGPALFTGEPPPSHRPQSNHTACIVCMYTTGFNGETQFTNIFASAVCYLFCCVR